MINKIPSSVEVICDCCKHSNTNGGFKTESHIKFSRHALDMHGDPAANGTVELDLCDHCAGIMSTVINEACDDIRNEKLRQS